ncbi:MAG: AmmeMemoRadiSam system protein B [Pontiellaceae bacterium]|nr:AmmeMemoRadiSam system protein B [Pontiellaceae bacterium]
MDSEDRVLKSELAGIWYTDDPRQLTREVDVYLDASEQKDLDSVIALLLPHAGYRYSGMVAAAAVRQISGRSFSRVIVLGASHRIPLPDSASIPDVDYIETPIGRTALDREVIETLWDAGFESRPEVHLHEHSVQIELPFLQRALGDFKLVPIVCGPLSQNGAQRIAQALLRCMDSETLVVVSSDFVHYGRTFGYLPFTDHIQENLRVLDFGAFKQIEEKSLSGFLDYIEETGATVCGRSPIAVLLAMLPEQAQVQLMKYDTSGNLTGDWNHCVSYLSAVVTGTWALPNSTNKGLSADDKAALLAIARHQIALRLGINVPDPAVDVTPAMKGVMGAFVTLHKHGQLRGCIGEIFPRRSLLEAVKEQAVNSAFHDPRFPRLREEELGEIDIEISALTAPHAVDSYEEIEIGRHGVVLYKGAHSAVFLPQVAPEQGWGLAETLTHLSMKAGLAPDAWHSDCEFHVFEAIVFGEK